MVSEELEQSLRAEVDAYVKSRLSSLQEEVARLQSQLNEGFTRLLEQSSDDTQPDASVAISISEYIRAAHERGVTEAAAQSAKAKASSDMAILKAAVDDLDDQRSQSEILNMLVHRAASFAPRVVFFVVKNEQAVGWRARGLEGSIGDTAVRNIVLPLSADTPISDVVKSRAVWSGTPGANAEDHLLLNKLGSEPPQRMVAIPLIVRNRAVAVLYADSAALDSDAINLEALETLVRVAGMAVELLATTRPAPEKRPERVVRESQQPASQSAESSDAEGAAARAGEESEALPASSAQEQIAHVESEPPSAIGGTQERGASAEQTVASSEQAASAPQATAVETGAGAEAAPQQAGPASSASVPASTTSSSFGAPLGAAKRYGSAADAELPVDVSEEERRLHNDARRFARLLVSEIKLYNEQKVKEGRSQGDIYERLREDIDRSRQMYDKRVAPPVAARYDYFHHELVNTLAEGDPAKLGDGYPGANVTA